MTTPLALFVAGVSLPLVAALAYVTAARAAALSFAGDADRDCRLGQANAQGLRRCWTHGCVTDVPPCPMAGSRP